MKFTYDDKEDRGECLAYIWEGHLVFKGGAVIGASGSVYADWSFRPDDFHATKKFYKDDEVKLTF